jgi:hypothetical protein
MVIPFQKCGCLGVTVYPHLLVSNHVAIRQRLTGRRLRTYACCHISQAAEQIDCGSKSRRRQKVSISVKVSQTVKEMVIWLCTISCASHILFWAKSPHRRNIHNIEKIQPFSKHISHYIDYFQSEACSVHHYPLNEWVILVISHLHITWRDAIKKKTQLVPQNGIIPPIPLEFHLQMLSVTLTQCCEEERLELPTSRTERPLNPSAPMFAIEDIQEYLADVSFKAPTSPDLVIGHT